MGVIILHAQKRPEWEFVGIYADEGMTGTKDNRKEFQRMLQDARDRKIDLMDINAKIKMYKSAKITMYKI
jgi:site-specific DNA recombinase